MATPAKLVRTKLLETLRSSGTIPCPVYRQFDGEIEVPFIRVRRGTWTREEIGKGYYQYEVAIPIEVVQVLQETPEADLDDLEDALDTLLLTKLVITGYNVDKQYIRTGEDDEDADEETGAILDIAPYELYMQLT